METALVRTLINMFRRYTLRYPVHILGTLTSNILTIAIEVITPILIGRLFEQLVGGRPISELGRTWGVLVGCYLLQFLTGYSSAQSTERLTASVIRDIRADIFLRLLHARRIPWKPGDVVTRALNDVVEAQSLITTLPLTTLLYFGWLVAIVSSIAVVDPLFLVFITIAPVYAVLAAKSNQKINAVSRELTVLRTKLAADIEESLDTFEGTQLDRLHTYWYRRFSETLTKFVAFRLYYTHVRSLTLSGVQLLNALFPATFLFVGATLLTESSVGVGELVAAYTYAIRLFVPIEALLNVSVSAAQAVPALNRVQDLLNLEQQQQEGNRLAVSRGTIEYRNVSFRYSDEQPLINNFSATFTRDRLNFIVGRNGAGKSTLIKLLVRLLEPDQGEILIDGQEVRTLSIDTLRMNVAVVPQRNVLIDGTVLENVALGNQGLSPDHICKMDHELGLKEVVRQLQRGWNTPVGRRGSYLSGGQAQRVSIARALVKGAPIIILDEATAHMDAASEAHLYQQLTELVGVKTVIVVTHKIPELACPIHVVNLDTTMCDAPVAERGFAPSPVGSTISQS